MAAKVSIDITCGDRDSELTRRAGCGSIPIHEGNNIKSGQLTVNYVDKPCNGICRNDISPSEAAPASPREAAPDSATNLLGINCRGSGRCSFTCKRNIFQLNNYVQSVSKSQLPDRISPTPATYITTDDDATYGNGQKIACVKCINESGHAEDTGFCAFPNNMKSGETINGAQAKTFMNALISHGCKGKNF
jgi:hypothetical protein